MGKLLSLPAHWSHVVVRRSIFCPESSSRYTCIASYEKDSSFGWCDGALSLAEVRSFDSLTFVVTIEIVRIIDAKKQIFFQADAPKPKQWQIEWQIGAELMQKMK